MDRRLELHQILSGIPGVKKAYFQPPESVKLEYPCIIYKLQNVDMRSANDHPYKNRDGYQVTIIDRNPDSQIRKVMETMMLCRFDRPFVSDGLNHWVYMLYY